MTNIYKKLALVFSTFALFTLVATSQTTVNVKVVDIADDIEEYRDNHTNGTVFTGYMDHGSSDLELTTESTDRRQCVGIIFRSVAIPKGATITSAFLQFTCDDDDNQEGPLPIDIWGIKEANTSAPFTDVAFNCTSRPNTTAKVTWSAPVWATKEARTDNEKTSDIKTLVQEIIDQAAWASGNNMGFKLTNDEMQNIHREAEAKDEGAGGEPELIVTYTTGVAVEKIDASNGLIYPNPSEGKFMVKNPSSGNFDYGIYTMNGSMVRTRENISGSETSVDMTNAAKGQYYVIVKSATQTAKSKLILK